MSNRQVLVSFGDRKKVITLRTCPDKSEDILLLTNEFKRVFEVTTTGNIIFQKFKEDWNEYIDIEEGTELANKDKLIAIVGATGENSSRASSSEIEEQEVGTDSTGCLSILELPVESPHNTSSSTVNTFSTNNEVSYIYL